MTDRELWFFIRQALIIMLRAIERYLSIKESRRCKIESIDESIIANTIVKSE